MNDSLLRYLWAYDLEQGEVMEPPFSQYNHPWDIFSVHGFQTDYGPSVIIGKRCNDIQIGATHWNRLVKIIRDKELDEEGIEAMLSLIGPPLREEHYSTLVSAIRDKKIKEIDLS